jgi:hypothetical protein
LEKGENPYVLGTVGIPKEKRGKKYSAWRRVECLGKGKNVWVGFWWWRGKRGTDGWVGKSIVVLDNGILNGKQVERD